MKSGNTVKSDKSNIVHISQAKPKEMFFSETFLEKLVEVNEYK